MYKDNINYDESLKRAMELFDSRIFKYRSDDLFITDFSKKESLVLHLKAENDIEYLKKY
jgi:hypothetical protein